MLDSIYHMTLKLIKNLIFGIKNVNILIYFMQCSNGGVQGTSKFISGEQGNR